MLMYFCNAEISIMHHQDQDDYWLNLIENSTNVEHEDGSSSNSSLTSTSDDNEDESADALKEKGWVDKIPVPQSQLQHEMNGQILPSNNPSDFGDVCIKNSSNVHLGSRVFYKGPVTIKQFVYTNSAAVPDHTTNVELQYKREDHKEKNTDNERKLSDNPSLSKSCSDSLFVVSNYKVMQWFCTRKCIFTISIVTSVLVSVTILSIWLSGMTYSSKQPYVPASFNDSSISYDPTIAGVCIVPRVEWGAQPPSKPPTSLRILPAPYVIISHTASVFCYTQAQCVLNVRVAQTFHIESKGWNDIGYNFLVGGDGLVYEGRGWNVEGAHTFNYNYKSIGISFIGTFNDVEPTKAQLHAAKKLIEFGVQHNGISMDYKLLGHRQCIKTESPGEALYNIIKTWDHWVPKP